MVDQLEKVLFLPMKLQSLSPATNQKQPESWRHIRAVGGEFVVLYIVQFSQYLIKFTDL